MSAGEPPATCAACGAEVLEAVTREGSRLVLQPEPSPRGPVAAVEHQDGTWHGRCLPFGDTQDLAGGEQRHGLHQTRCEGRGGSLGQVREAQANAAREARTARGRSRPRPGLGRIAGVRKAGPGAHR
jgi:hypothetical protein